MCWYVGVVHLGIMTTFILKGIFELNYLWMSSSSLCDIHLVYPTNQGVFSPQSLCGSSPGSSLISQGSEKYDVVDRAERLQDHKASLNANMASMLKQNCRDRSVRALGLWLPWQRRMWGRVDRWEDTDFCRSTMFSALRKTHMRTRTLDIVRTDCCILMPFHNSCAV